MISQAIYRHLQAAGEVDAIVKGRIYPLKLPLNPTLPAIVHQLIDAPRDYDHSGASGIAIPVLQLTSWAADIDTAIEIAARIQRTLSGFTGSLGGILPVRGCFLIAEADGDDPETGWLRRRQDWSIRAREGGLT